MLNKNIQKMKLRKNKRVKDEKKAAERERVLPRNRQNTGPNREIDLLTKETVKTFLIDSKKAKFKI